MPSATSRTLFTACGVGNSAGAAVAASPAAGGATTEGGPTGDG